MQTARRARRIPHGPAVPVPPRASRGAAALRSPASLRAAGQGQAALLDRTEHHLAGTAPGRRERRRGWGGDRDAPRAAKARSRPVPEAVALLIPFGAGAPRPLLCCLRRRGAAPRPPPVEPRSGRPMSRRRSGAARPPPEASRPPLSL